MLTWLDLLVFLIFSLYACQFKDDSFRIRAMNGSAYPLLFPRELPAIQQDSYIRGDGIPGAKADSFRSSISHCDDLTSLVNITLADPSLNGDAYRHIIKASLS